MVFQSTYRIPAIVCALLIAWLVQTEPRALGDEMTLVTASGDRLVGEWRNAADADVVAWQAKDFVGPFEFLPDSLAAVYGKIAEKGESMDCICELVTGDILCGMPVSLNAETLRFESKASSEIVSIPRRFIRRITGPTKSDALILDFPGTGNALLTNVSRAWRLNGGKLVADTDDATCFLKLPELPTRALVNVDLSWEANTDFAVSLVPELKDVAKPKPPVPRRANQRRQKSVTLDYQGLQLERWGDRIVLAAQEDEEGDLLLVADDMKASKAGRLRLQIYLDAKQHTASVYRDGQAIGKLSLPFPLKNWKRATVVRFESYEGQLAVERLRVSTWNGCGPFESGGSEAAVVRMADGRELSGNVLAWNAKAKEFTLEDRPAKKVGNDEEQKDEDLTDGDDEEGDETTDVPLADMVEILFSNPSLPETAIAGEVTVLTETGSQVAGTYAGIRDGRLHIECSRWKQTVSFPIDSIVSAVFGGRSSNSDEKRQGVHGTLRLEGCEIKGRLVTAKADDGATCLAWRPASAENAQSLLPESNGTITYRQASAAEKKKSPRQRELERGAVAGFFRKLALEVARFDENATETQSTDPVPVVNLMTLELRSGDSIPFKPKRIDEEGVTFESPLSDVTFVSHAQVKAISLRTELSPAELTEVKRERLLTVPRRYKDRPPTHLLLSVNKDILRGRLISMDDEYVTIEMRLTPRRIPRERVAAILWLDEVVEPDDEADDAEDTDASEPPAVGPGGFHVLASKRGGQRITIIPDHCEASVLYGMNPVLKECKLDLAEVDELAFGSDIVSVVNALETSKIVLSNAPQPLFMNEDGEEGAGDSGQISPLVGEPAPPIKLKRLNGQPYDLEEEKKKRKVIVLDFWATWCGPCIQWMPRAESVVDEFSEEDVELVAVNLGETEDVITPVLDRLDLDPTTILDIDGVVADLYKATAIPQTVVIDRDGNVDRVFVGGGKQNETLLRESLKTLTEK